MEGVCVKVPEKRVAELLKMDGINPFVARNRKMREWVLIVRENSEDYLKDKNIFEESVEYVSEIAKIKQKKK
jgi:hypothetical protein